MSLDHAFDLWDWSNVAGLVLVGVVMGYFLFPYAWPDRQKAGRKFPALMGGFLAAGAFAVFFVFLIAFRYASGLDPVIAAKTIGTGCEGVVFALSLGVGLHFRPAHAAEVSLEDVLAQLAEIKRLTGIASESAEAGRIAASAADDRVISQSEHAASERARSQRVEATGEDTNHRAQDIQERIQ